MTWDTDFKENPTFPEVQLRKRKRLLVWDWLLSPSLWFRFPSRGRIPVTGAPMSVLKPRLLFQLKFQLRYRCHGNYKKKRTSHNKSGYDFSVIGWFLMNLTHSFQNFPSSPSSSHQCCSLMRRSWVMLQRPVYEEQNSAVSSLSFSYLCLRLEVSTEERSARTFLPRGDV